MDLRVFGFMVLRSLRTTRPRVRVPAAHGPPSHARPGALREGSPSAEGQGDLAVGTDGAGRPFVPPAEPPRCRSEDGLVRDSEQETSRIAKSANPFPSVERWIPVGLGAAIVQSSVRVRPGSREEVRRARGEGREPFVVRTPRGRKAGRRVDKIAPTGYRSDRFSCEYGRLQGRSGCRYTTHGLEEPLPALDPMRHGG
jgi:hypothetical protein